MTGDLLYHALRQATPDLYVDLVASLEEVHQPEPGVLLYNFMDRGCDAASVEKGLAKFQDRFSRHPLVVIIDIAGERIDALMKQYGVASCVPASAGFQAVAAAVRDAAVVTDSPAHLRLDPAPEIVGNVTPNHPRAQDLTAKEHQVLHLLHEGKSNKLIAFELGCSENTVKVHIANTMRKLRLHNRTQLALVYQANIRPAGEADVSYIGKH